MWRSGWIGWSCAMMSLGCAPSSTTDQQVVVNEPPDARASDVSAGSDRGVSDDAVIAVDAATPVDSVAPADVPVSVDVPVAMDVPVVMDVPVTVDAPVGIDAAPVDAGCSLPPPVARPPATIPSGEAVVRAVADEHPDWLRDSCVASGGSYRFLFEVLRRGRSVDPRWGLNRSASGVSGDIVTYFYGDGCPEGRREVYLFDVITRLCPGPTDAPAAPGWIDRSVEGGVWTLAGYDGSALPDAGPPPVDVPVSRPPLPDGRGELNAVARDHPDQLQNSCVTMGGTNDFLFEVVRRLRRIDRRWGLNWKRGVVGDMSQDVVNYYYGPAGAPMEGSTETYVVDVIGGHCGPTPTTAWNDVTGVGGALARWTLAGRTDLGP